MPTPTPSAAASAIAADHPLTSTDAIKGFLNANFSTLGTAIGSTEFTFGVFENASVTRPYDYDVWVRYSFQFFYDVQYSIKVSDEVNRQVAAELQAHQEKLAKALVARMPDKKLTGRYIYTWYEYPTIQVGFHSRKYYSWTNYAPQSILTPYHEATISGFRWYPDLDDKLTR